jgi:hypothetical protein
MRPSDRNIHQIFFMKTLMHTNTSSKTTHSIKTSLIKQCYICYAWTGANNVADIVMLLILIWCWYCWYWYAADTVMLLIYWYCWYVCSILHAQYFVLDQYIFHYCITLKSCSAKSCPLKTKQIQHFIQPFEIIQNIISS